MDQPEEPRPLEPFPEFTPAEEAVEAVELAIEEGEARGGRLRRYTALGIVIASILAAAMAWRASVADEAAAAREQLAEQNLLQGQQLTAGDEQTVIQDLRLFDRYEAHVDLAHFLLRDAAQATGSSAAGLAIRAHGELALARAELPQFQGVQPSVRADGTATFDAAYARSQARLRDVELLNLQPPEQLRAQAASLHERGVRLTGLAVLFVGAVVLLTFAELSDARRARLFGPSGAALAAAAVVLYFVV